MLEPAGPPAPAQQPQVQSAGPPTTSPNDEVAAPPTRPSVALPEQTVAEYPILPLQRFVARTGSKVRIEGTANIIHPTWQVESPVIGGFLEVGPGFPLEPGQTLEPGPVQAQAEAFIAVRSLKSVEPDGRPYSDRMDEIMYESLREKQNHTIRYRLLEMSLKGATNYNNVLQYEFDSRGELVVAGVTNEITMPVFVLPLGGGKLKSLRRHIAQDDLRSA